MCKPTRYMRFRLRSELRLCGCWAAGGVSTPEPRWWWNLSLDNTEEAEEAGDGVELGPGPEDAWEPPAR